MSEGPGPHRPVHDPSIESRSAERIRELEVQVASLTANRDRWRDMARRNAERAERAYRQGGAISRALRAGAELRAAVRHPRRVPALPGRLRAALRKPPVLDEAEEVPEPGGGARETAADERRTAVLAAIRRRQAEATPRAVRDLRVALVADDDAAFAISGECQVIPVRADDRPEAVLEKEPDLLLIVSSWAATGGSWSHRLAWTPEVAVNGLPELAGLIAACARRGVPSVSWATEDPGHHERFADAADLADIVATIDEASAERHLARPTRRGAIVDVVSWGVSPRRYHPDTASLPALGGAAFVGSFDVTAPIADRRALERLLDGAVEAGLTVHDRHAWATGSVFALPDRFRPLVPARLSSAALPAALRSAGAVLVAGATAGSTTAFPPFLLESIAAGRPVVAPQGPAAAGIAADAGDTVTLLGRADDPREVVRRVLDAGDRGPALEPALRILDRHALGDRLADLARAAGLPVRSRPGIALLRIVEAGSTDPALEHLAADLVAGASRPTEVVIGVRADNGRDDAWEATGRPLQAALTVALRDIPVRLVAIAAGMPDGEAVRRLAAASSAEEALLLHPGDRLGTEDLRAFAVARLWSDEPRLTRPGREDGPALLARGTLLAGQSVGRAPRDSRPATVAIPEGTRP